MSDYELAHAYDTVNLYRREGAAKVELNRPERLNAWDQQFGLDLRDAIERTGSDDDVRAVVITGAGRGFSSGADLKEMGEDHPRLPDGRPDVYKVLTERYHPIITGCPSRWWRRSTAPRWASAARWPSAPTWW
jgi:2-(1,2-epoxy-1,2-dihydrophenyl)acetyl-CoA isomerase